MADFKFNYGPYNEGFIAEANDEAVSANPFPAGSDDHREWYLGWCDGYHARLEAQRFAA